MVDPPSDPAWGPLPFLLGHLLVLFLLVALPVWDRIETRRLKTTRDPDAKRRSYRQTIAMLWIAAILAVVVAGPGLVSPPEGGTVPSWLPPGGAIATGMVIGAVAPALAVLVSPALRAKLVAPLARLSFFLPGTPTERRWFALVSVRAGICEEVLYRGFLLRYLLALPFGLSLVAALVASSLMFGLAHLYQGAAGVVGTAAMAFALGLLYLTSGSLLLPILLHTLIDLRVLLLWRPDAAPAAPAAP